jgi:hypothetical protein
MGWGGVGEGAEGLREADEGCVGDWGCEGGGEGMRAGGGGGGWS